MLPGRRNTRRTTLAMREARPRVKRRALELATPDDPAIGTRHIAQARHLASTVVVDVLRRYPAAPLRRGRAGELIRSLDASLR